MGRKKAKQYKNVFLRLPQNNAIKVRLPLSFDLSMQFLSSNMVSIAHDSQKPLRLLLMRNLDSIFNKFNKVEILEHYSATSG